MRGGGGEVEKNEVDSIETSPTPIPPLRFLGDERLMQRQSDMTLSEMQTEEFANKLEVLRLAMHHYGGIGIAAPQVGWWTRYVVFRSAIRKC